MTVSREAAQKALNYAVSLGLVQSGNNDQNLQRMQEVLASFKDPSAGPQRDLHAEIMNIPCTRPAGITAETPEMAYSMGHRDARHRAAELTLQDS
ncbi:hypothetical protein [Comamonas thiooxydans]|uniref:hypothetical protein n=1 Tax=Comamonas thiooxydans TaxID=363952 RepID=UPI0011861E7A|nr:hypothetical protein [Comamonas thiooxydans]